MIQRVVILCVLATLSTPALAMRCGTKIVSNGDHQAKILKRCGEPTAVLTRNIYRGGYPTRRTASTQRHVRDDQELLIHDRSVVEVIVEEWTYNLGPRKLMRVIRFENGIVTSVKRLGYGYRE